MLSGYVHSRNTLCKSCTAINLDGNYNTLSHHNNIRQLTYYLLSDKIVDMDTDKTNITTATITDKVKIGIKDALALYYAGATIRDAFKEERAVSREHYYRLKKSHPEEIAVLDAEAKALSVSQRESTLSRLDSALVEGSSNAQIAAMNAINEHLIQRLVDIVSLRGWEVNYRGDVIDVSVFPRDIAEAGRLLRDIAKEGLIPHVTQIGRLSDKISSGSQATSPTNIAFLGARTDWSEVKLIKEDGTEVSVSADDDVIDVEVKEHKDQALL